jgi:hypothetical protein
MAQEAARRTAAILDADAIGLARGTVAKSDWTAWLTQHRTERLEPTVARHGGRVIVTDEGVRAEFPSAAQALGAAIAFRQAMADANREEDADSAVVFSLGLHLAEAGWPIKQPSKLTAGGSIVVAASPSDSVADRVKASFAELGSAGLGTVEQPVHTFEVGRDPADWPAASAAAAQSIPQNDRKRTSLWPVLVAALVAVGVFYLADAPRSPPAAAGVPQRTAEERQRLQEDAVAAFALWREGEGTGRGGAGRARGPGRKGRQRRADR